MREIINTFTFLRKGFKVFFSFASFIYLGGLAVLMNNIVRNWPALSDPLMPYEVYLVGLLSLVGFFYFCNSLVDLAETTLKVMRK